MGAQLGTLTQNKVKHIRNITYTYNGYGFSSSLHWTILAWYFSETFSPPNTTIIQKMTYKGYLQRGTKLGNLASRLLQAVNSHLSMILTPIHANTSRNKINILNQHCISPSYEQYGSGSMKKFNVKKEL